MTALSRQQRRRLERALPKLFERMCSFCGSSFLHNSATAGGFDAAGNVVLTSECCVHRVAQIFVRGFYSNRYYDFLRPPNTKPSTNTEPTSQQIGDLVPLAHDEAVVHGLFEVVMGHEPMPPDRQALPVLIAKYATRRRT
jgi:hypothetical protein